jgi:ADP-ribose pyrophosphatase YjhB (NUDIX family)
MPAGPRLRQAVRAVIVDPAERVLLVRFRFGDGASVWALPGGGVEPDEDEVDALRRELAEEVGLVDVDFVGPIWHRTHMFRDPVRFDGQAERIYFVRSAAFDPQPHMTWDELRAEGMVDLRWWTIPELVATVETLVPARLAALMGDLVAGSVPTVAIDVGE